MPLIKAQLAAGCVMFVLCFVYILIYFITIFRVYRAKQSRSIYPQVQNPSNAGIITAPPMNSYVQPFPVVNNGNPVSVVVCPTCNTAMNMTTSKRPPM